MDYGHNKRGRASSFRGRGGPQTMAKKRSHKKGGKPQKQSCVCPISTKQNRQCDMLQWLRAPLKAIAVGGNGSIVD